MYSESDKKDLYVDDKLNEEHKDMTAFVIIIKGSVVCLVQKSEMLTLQCNRSYLYSTLPQSYTVNLMEK